MGFCVLLKLFVLRDSILRNIGVHILQDEDGMIRPFCVSNCPHSHLEIC